MVNSITCGAFSFSDADVLETGGECYNSSSVSTDSIEYDTLNFSVSTNTSPAKYNIADIVKIPYGTETIYKHSGTLISKNYVSSITRTGKYSALIKCVSAVGILANITHYGGIYNGESAGAVITDIIGGVVPCTVSPDVAACPLYGHLPIDNAAENLHQVLFAIGATITKDTSGNMLVSFPTSGAPTAIGDDSFYYGGKLEYLTPCSRVEVTEHGYAALPTDVLYTLFDNTTGIGEAENQLVKFDAPYHDIKATGCTISQVNANHMVVNGTGIVTGLRYTHTMRVVAADNADATTENVIQVQNATLVSAINSETVLQRVLSYHSSTKKITSGILPRGMRAGTEISFSDPFDEASTGILQSLDFEISNTLKADAVIITGYSPKYHGNTYSKSTVLTGSGYFTVPAGVTSVRATIIGSGWSGSGATNGQDAQSGTTHSSSTARYGYNAGTAGNGGIAGEGGSGGNIYTVVMPVTAGQKLPYFCGAAPAGGASVPYNTTPAKKKAGQDSTFNFVSSNLGSVSDLGFVDYFTKKVYGKRGADGVEGSAGGYGGTREIISDGHSEDVNMPAASGGGNGGAPSANIYKEFDEQGHQTPEWYFCGGGGGGGGGAYGRKGGNAQAPYYTLPENSEQIAKYYAGKGGNGANATAPPAATYGSGGGGGNGGGGAGATGSVSGYYRLSNYAFFPENSTGGSGSASGAGGAGVIILYY